MLFINWNGYNPISCVLFTHDYENENFVQGEAMLS